jgi:hypothetical protein
MESLHTTAASALRRLLDDQPTTGAKMAFIWTMAAGPAFGRATTTRWLDGVLTVKASSDAWRRELRHARPILLARVRELAGPGVVKTLVIE